MIEDKVEIFPFVTMVWNGKEIREEWEPVKQTMTVALHEAELEMIKRGFRNCDAYGFTPRDVDTQINKIIERGLIPLMIHKTQAHAGYDHKFYFTDEMTLDTYIYSVVADTYENAKKFRDAHLRSEGTDHRLVGELLGYDDHCMDFFLPIWLGEGGRKKVADPMFETAENTEGAELIGDNEIIVYGPPELNRLSKYFGMQLCPYFTCSFKCEGALKFAKEMYSIVHEAYPDESEALVEFLNMPVTWSLREGVTYVTHPLFRGATNGYWWDTERTVHWKPM